MKLPAIIGLFLLTLTFFSCNNAGSSREELLSTEVRQEALEVLQQTLRDSLRWEKVHAAEALIHLHYFDSIEEVFLEEERQRGHEPQYRIGIWRVLAQLPTYQGHPNPWIEKILEVYNQPDATDRIHASESIAKLKYPVDALPDEKSKIVTLFTQWANAYRSKGDAEKSMDYFLELISTSTPREKRLAAYALRHLENLDPSRLDRLSELALTENDSSTAKMFLLSAAFSKVPSDSVTTRQWLHQEMSLRAANSNKSDLYELTQTLALNGDATDIPFLQSILSAIGSSEFSENEKKDLKVGAAYGLLRIDRRVDTKLAFGDWFVIFVYGALMLGIGWYYSRKNKSREDFLLGGRNMNPIAVGISLFATLLSTLSYLSYPGEMIQNGPVIFAGMLALPLVYYVVGWWLIPKIMKMNVTSAYEILEQKFGVSVRMLATFMFLSLRFLWMATIIYVTVDIALFSVAPFDRSYSLPIGLILILVTILYTAMGGLKAVVVTDVLQSIIFLGGAFLSILVVCIHFGSFTSWLPDQWPTVWEAPKFGFDTKERTTVANAMMMIFLWYVCTSGSDQMAVQRYLATQDIRAARKSLRVSLYTNLLAKALLGLVGLAVFAYFSKNQHLLADGQSIREQADTLFPRFIVIGLPVGVSGLVIAGLIAAAMSSISSGVNSVSSVISEDLIQRFRTSTSSREGLLRQVQLLSYATGAIVMVLSIYIGNVEGNLLDLVNKVVNLLVAPLFVLFFLALFIPFSTTAGALAGGILSTIAACLISFYGIFGITVLWIIPVSLLVGVASGVLISLLENLQKKSFSNAQK